MYVFLLKMKKYGIIQNSTELNRRKAIGTASYKLTRIILILSPIFAFLKHKCTFFLFFE